jgi:dsDNA-specific endonuclease/ATPase MutS2
VQTPFGKGVVREARNNGRLLVDVQGRALEIEECDLARLDVGSRRSRAHAGEPEPFAPPASSPRQTHHAPGEVDLHGLTVEEALTRAADALNDAMLAGLPELRFIHGRRGGRIRAALGRWLGDIPTVRAFGQDPRNEGVTIVTL